MECLRVVCDWCDRWLSFVCFFVALVIICLLFAWLFSVFLSCLRVDLCFDLLCAWWFWFDFVCLCLYLLDLWVAFICVLCFDV